MAEIAGYDIVVADTVNHLLRGLSLADGTVTHGRRHRQPVAIRPGSGPHDAVSVDLSSPWDVAWFDDKVIVAMAGIHELWWFDPIKRTAGVYAGTTVEALRDGPLAEVWMAQPSGLSSAGGRLWIADSESSAIRWVLDGEMHTAAGQGLFDFGLMDGPAETALFQHPLGVCGLPDGSVLVADTYNGAVRLITPSDADGRPHGSDGRHRVRRAERHRPYAGRRDRGRRVGRASADPAGAGCPGVGRHHRRRRPDAYGAPADLARARAR